MDESSLRILLTLGGMIASVAAAFAVVRQSVKTLTETLADVEVRLRRLDSKIDVASIKAMHNGKHPKNGEM